MFIHEISYADSIRPSCAFAEVCIVYLELSGQQRLRGGARGHAPPPPTDSYAYDMLTIPCEFVLGLNITFIVNEVQAWM